MKLLTEYLSAKVKIKYGFPFEDENINEQTIFNIIDFLDDNGFKKLDFIYGLATPFEQMYNKLSKGQHNKSYMTFNDDREIWVKFCNDKEINADNPIYTIQIYDGKQGFYKNWVNQCLKFIRFKTLKELKEEVDKSFNWIYYERTK